MKSAKEFGVILNTEKIRKECNNDLEDLTRFRRVADYLSATQLYLKSNFLLKEPLSVDHIKDRLLGHWGTCPGINLVYAHCSYLLRKHSDLEMFLVVGPGHGAPAVLSNLWLEGTLEKYYQDYSRDQKGLEMLIKKFSWPGGFPSHVNAQLPGTIHEGGELGYALSTAFGAVMDNPNLIVTCIIGDGEAETGPTACSWHSYKFLDPKESGAVLPIIHLNGYKISSKTILGTMNDEDIVNMYTGYGYQVRIVKDISDIEADLASSLEWALGEIRKIQNAAREKSSEQPIFQPKWPLLVLKTPKGWGCTKTLNHKQIEGTFRSHGIPIMDPKTNPISLKAIEDWFKSYHIEELLSNSSSKTIFKDEIIERVLPEPSRRMGMNAHTNPTPKSLNLPELKKFMVSKEDQKNSSPTKMGGEYLVEVIKKNPNSFRIVSPDELESNRLGSVLSVTDRNMQWDEARANKGGRVMEILSEHTCQGWMQGYTLTGRYAIFPSYETFLGIITTMMIQWAKFNKIARETKWRNPVPSINYIETSTLWRQEHNGFSHQNPSFLNNIINLKSSMVRVYLPPDSNCFLSTLKHTLNSKNYVNLIISSKAEIPNYLNPEEAELHCMAGASVWEWCSTDKGINPDVVLVGCGCEVTTEVVEAATLLKRDIPELRVRVVNVTDLMILDDQYNHPHGLSPESFISLFTSDKPVIFNFHGYPSVIKQLLMTRIHPERFHVNGYMEEGTTTTPFDMLVCNKTSRYHVAKNALQFATLCKDSMVSIRSHKMMSFYDHQIRQHRKYIREYGQDPVDLNNF